MVTGQLDPTIDEQMKTKGHGTIHVCVFHLNHGTIDEGKKKKKFSVDANPKDIIVQIGEREVVFHIEDLVKESAEIVEKAEIQKRIADKIAEQKAEREREKK